MNFYAPKEFFGACEDASYAWKEVENPLVEATKYIMTLIQDRKDFEVEVSRWSKP